MEGDSVRGEFPNYSQWYKNPTKVEFIIYGSSQKMYLTPLNAKKFVVEGYDEYISYSGSRLLNPIEDQILLNNGFTISPVDVEENVVVFLRVVARTTGINLYMLHDSKRVNFFYQIPVDTIVELRYKKSISANRISEMAEYRNQITKLFSEKIQEKNMSATLRRLSYQESSLAGFFNDLFPVINRERKHKNAGSKWVLSAGLSSNFIHIGSDFPPGSVPNKHNLSVFPVVSFGYYSPVARKFGKYFFNPQLSLSRYKITGETYYNPFTIKATYKVDLLIGIQVNSGVNLINKEDFKFFIAAGLGGLIQIGGEKTLATYQTSNSPETDVYKLRTINYLIDASTGITINKRNLISASYMFPVSINGSPYYTTPKLSGIQLKMVHLLN